MSSDACPRRRPRSEEIAQKNRATQRDDVSPISFLQKADRTTEECDVFEQARAGNIAGPVEAVRVRRDGADVDIEMVVVPIRGPDGRVSWLALYVRGIAERKAAERHRALLNHELSHRVKNALATVHAIAAQTSKTAATSEAFVASFSGRIMAMARAHDLLAGGGWQGASLREILESELTPHRTDTGNGWSCDGPATRLNSKTALPLAMALHELATNAAKYGALSVPAGHVTVTWEWLSAEGSGSLLRLLWVEAGGPPVAPSPSNGFGTRLIREGLAYQLDGEAILEFDATGVRCAISFPFDEPEQVLPEAERGAR